jgi:hypothetical protein
MLREMMSPQRLSRTLHISVDGSAVAGSSDQANVEGLLEGQLHCTITEIGSGEYKIWYNVPFARLPVVQLTPVTDVTTVRIKTQNVAYTIVEQVGADQTTPEADADFHMTVTGWDTADYT